MESDRLLLQVLMLIVVMLLHIALRVDKDSPWIVRFIYGMAVLTTGWKVLYG